MYWNNLEIDTRAYPGRCPGCQGVESLLAGVEYRHEQHRHECEDHEGGKNPHVTREGGVYYPYGQQGRDRRPV
jgi:hypothetical protein